MITSRVRRVSAYAASAAVLSVGAMGAMAGETSAAESTMGVGGGTGSFHGCPVGAVCIYPGTGWNGNSPSKVYWSYGVHKLYEQYGNHRIVNNQYGGATVSFCKTSKGTKCSNTMKGGFYGVRYLTPINTIKLAA